MRPQPRAARAAATEDLVTWLTGAVLGGLLALGLLVWSAGQLAGLLAHRRWPAVPVNAAAAIAMRLPAHLSDPAASWPPPARQAMAGAVLFYVVLLVLVCLLGAAGVAVLALANALRRRPSAASDRHRALAWGRRRDIRHLLVTGPARGRLVLGRLTSGRSGRRGPLVAAEPRRSVLVVAPTQVGKTSRFVVPAVLRWNGPLLVTSVKTDVLRLTHAERARRGRVHVFDPTGSTRFATTKWSPLLACTDYPAADRVASWLVQAAGESRAGENARFWEGLGAKLLAPLLFAAARSGGGLRQVSAWVDRRQTDEVTELLGFLADTDAIDAWAASCAREERQRDSVYATAESILKGFASPSARAATQVSAADHVAERVLDVARLIAEGETLYLVAPAHAQAQLRPLFEALVQAVLRAAQDAYAASGAPLDPPLLLMLDEAANIAPLRDLATYASTGAGQGISICSVWQDVAQIEAIYGRKAATVVNNHTARVFLPGSADLTTLDQTSRMIGEFEHDRVSVSIGRDGGCSVSTSTAQARVAPVEYLRQLPADTAVVLYGRDPALRLLTTPWYQDRALRRLVDPAEAAAADAAAAGKPVHNGRKRSCPQLPALPVAIPPATTPTGLGPHRAAPPDQAEESTMSEQNRFRPAVVPIGPSMLDRLAEVPGTDHYVDITTGREYTIHHAVDGTPIPIPMQMTEAEQAEINRRSDRYQAELREIYEASAPDGLP